MLYFIRHGESEANVHGFFAGQKDDSKLTARGVEQARAAAKDIIERGIKFDRIVSSSMLRAKHTAELIAEGINYPKEKIQYDLRAMEYDPGDLTKQPVEAFTADVRQTPHNEEDPDEFQSRVIDMVKELKALPGNTLLVSHAGVAKTILDNKEGLRPKDFYRMEEYPNAKLIRIG